MSGDTEMTSFLFGDLEPYATPQEKKILAAIESEGTQRKAAKLLNLARGTVSAAMIRLRKRAAKRNPHLHNFEAPPGYQLRGVSTLLNSKGEVAQTWVKTAKEYDRAGDVLESFKASVAEIPRRLPLEFNIESDSDLLTVYPIGDAHIGMLAWGVETGVDFDLKIAERNLKVAAQKIIDSSPPSKKALVINLGDFAHTDSTRSETTSGTRLDSDSRWGKMLQVGHRVLVFFAHLALEKHEEVEFVINKGNHDYHTAVMLAMCLREHFRNEPRLKMLELPQDYTYVEFGENLIGTTHGNLCKPERLPGIMSVDQRQAWGRTKNRHWYVGHFHHRQVLKEHPGCTVETVQTLASADAWHHSSGYRAGRSIFCDVWHRTKGLKDRHTIGIEEIEAA